MGVPKHKWWVSPNGLPKWRKGAPSGVGVSKWMPTSAHGPPRIEPGDRETRRPGQGDGDGTRKAENNGEPCAGHHASEVRAEDLDLETHRRIVDSTPPMVTINFVMTDLTWENGPIRQIPRSHTWQVPPPAAKGRTRVDAPFPRLSARPPAPGCSATTAPGTAERQISVAKSARFPTSSTAHRGSPADAAGKPCRITFRREAWHRRRSDVLERERRTPKRRRDSFGMWPECFGPFRLVRHDDELALFDSADQARFKF